MSETLDGVMVKRIGDDAFSDCSSLILTVGRDSYAKRYAIDHDLRYPDALDWLKN